MVGGSCTIPTYNALFGLVGIDGFDTFFVIHIPSIDFKKGRFNMKFIAETQSTNAVVPPQLQAQWMWKIDPPDLCTQCTQMQNCGETGRPVL